MKKTGLYVATFLTISCAMLMPSGTSRAQSEAMPFVATFLNLSEAGFAGCSLSDSGLSHSNPAYPVMRDRKLSVSAGWMSLAPDYYGTSCFSVDAGMVLGKKFGVCVLAAYGLDRPYEEFNSGGYSTGTFRPRQLIAGAGFCYRPLSFLSVGVNVKYAGEKLTSAAGYGALVTDIALAADVPLGHGIRIKATAGAYSLGTKVKASDGSSYRLPSEARGEVGYFQEFTPRHRLEILGAADVFFNRKFSAAAGLGYTWNSMLTARLGYRYGGNSVIPSYASAGIGVKFFGVSLDAVWLFGSKILRNSFGLSLGYGF